MSAEAGPRLPRAHWLVWVFAVVGLIGILAIIALTAMLFNVGRPYQPAKVAGAKPETVFTLGSPDELIGTNLIRIDIRAQDSRGGSSSYSGRDDTRNVLLLDKVTGASRKLLLDNSRHIDQTRFLPAKAGLVANDDDALMGVGTETPSHPPPAYYVLTVTRDGSEGARDILVGSLSGGRQAYVMRGVDGVDSMWMQSPTQIGFLVRERLGLYYRIVDIPTLKVTVSRRVAID